MLYADELETVNVLGSKTGGHKLVGVYMTLRNLPPKYNSCFQNIHVVTLAHATDVKKYGYDKILQPIIQEIAELEKGISLNVLGEIQQVRGTLLDFAGDNLGRHQGG